MSVVWSEKPIWVSGSGEYELHRSERVNCAQGSFISIERYTFDGYKEDGEQKELAEYFETDERYWYLACKGYLESMGFVVTKPLP